MKMMLYLFVSFFLLVAPALSQSFWTRTKFLFVFGDSYTTTGFNISLGIDSPDPGFTSSNGRNWVEYLSESYNTTDMKVLNLAYGGATIDSALVPPYLPTVLSIVQQVNQFQEIVAPRPAGADWTGSDSLFAFWIGINDIGNSFGWDNMTVNGFYDTLMERYMSQLEALYSSGARSFLFLTVPPTDRAPLWFQQGNTISQQMKSDISLYNADLQKMVNTFKSNHTNLDTVMVFDTQPVFNTLLDNADPLGYVNITGWCESYENGTPSESTEVQPCPPASSYFWLNSLHPIFTVHDVLAKALSTALSALK